MADETLLKDLMQLDLSEYITTPYNITTNPDTDKQPMLLSDYVRSTTIGDEWKTPAQDTLTMKNDKPGFVGKTVWSFGTKMVDVVHNIPAGLTIAGVTNPISTAVGAAAGIKGAEIGGVLAGKLLTKTATAGLPKYISAALNYTGKAAGAVAGGAAGVATVAGAASLLTSGGGSPVNPDTKRRRNVLVYPEETPRNVLANQLYTGELDRELTPSELVGEATELYAQKKITEKEYTNRLQEAYDLQQKLKNEAVDLLKGREYPDADVAGSVLSWATDWIQDRKLLRAVQMEARGQNPNDFSYQAGAVAGSIAEIMAANYLYRSALLRPRLKTLHKGSRFRETVVEEGNPFTRQQISDKLQNFGKKFIGAQELANYTAESAMDYIERTGDKDLVYYQPSDIQGLMAGGYSAISAITEYELGGIEDIMTGAFKKVGLKSPVALAYLKGGTQESAEEILQNLEEFLARKIDGTTDKTWGEAFKESLIAGVWALGMGGFVAGTTFKIARSNLVKGIMKFGEDKGIKIDTPTATKIADTMMETVSGSLDPKKKDLWNNLRDKISFMMETSDIANKEDRIDSITDLEYALIAADAGFDGIDIEKHPLFQGEVNKLGWFRADIPEESRAVVNDLLAELNDLETQLKTLNEAKEKDWEKIDEIERRLEQFDRYVLDKLGENAPASLRELDNELRKVENKYIAKEKKKKGVKVPTDTVETTKSALIQREGGPAIASDNVVIKPVEIKNVPNFTKTSDLRNWLVKIFDKIKSVKIDSTGNTVDFTKSSARRVVKNARKQENNMAYPEIKNVVKIAQYSGFRKADSEHPNVIGQDVYHSAILVNGIPYSVEFYVDLPKDSSAKNNFAGNKVSRIEIGLAATQGIPTAQTSPIDNISIGVLREKVKPARYKNGVLYQKSTKGARRFGAYIPELRFIERTNKMDASTLSHELAHDWFEINFDKFRSGKASPEFMRAWGALEKALGITDKSTKAEKAKASEAFARAYEGWIMSNKGWEKLINVDDKDKDDVIKLMLDYQSDLRDIYQDLTNPYFKQTWGKLGEMKPEIKAWFDKVVNITDIDKLVERGEMTPEQASQEKLNQAIDTVIENTEDAETKKTLKTMRVLNDTKRYEAEGGNKNSLQVRLANLAKAIDENNMLIKENYDTHRDMLEVAKQADNFVKTRLEDALAIINGQMAEQEGLFKEDIYTALERLALENGDLNLLDELKNSEVANRLAKELGQRVAGFRNWNAGDVDVVSSLKALDNKFNKALQNKKAQAQMAEAEQMFAKAQEQQDKLADKELDSVLKDMECR